MKILLVDDEKAARNILVSTLNKLGYSKVISACNGLEAMDLIEAENFDVVLADIRMPGMSGLELMEQVRKKSNDILFVIISGFDLFEYAKKAIQLGAFDYLLKPVSELDLASMIKKVANAHEQKLLIKENNVIEGIKINQSSEVMKRKFIEELVTSEELSKNYVINTCAERNMNFHGKQLCVAIISKDDNLISIIDDKHLLHFSLENIISELLVDQGIHTRFFDASNGIGCLLILDPGQESEKHMILKLTFSEVVRCVKELLKINVTVGIGKIINDYTGLHKSMDCANKSLNQRLVNGGCSVYKTDDCTLIATPKTKFNAIMEKVILDGLEKCAVHELIIIIENLYSSFKESVVLDFNELKKLNLQLIFTLYKALKLSKIDPSTFLGDEFILYSEVNNLESIDCMAAFMNEKLNIVIEAISQRREKNSIKILDISISYIRDNIAGSISLEVVAQYVNMSPGHLSRLFRQELGESFINFLINERINKAKELLKEGKYKAKDVALLTGFNDDKHFYKTFKKLTGFTPNEYKEL